MNDITKTNYICSGCGRDLVVQNSVVAEDYKILRHKVEIFLDIVEEGNWKYINKYSDEIEKFLTEHPYLLL